MEQESRLTLSLLHCILKGETNNFKNCRCIFEVQNHNIQLFPWNKVSDTYANLKAEVVSANFHLPWSAVILEELQVSISRVTARFALISSTLIIIIDHDFRSVFDSI